MTNDEFNDAVDIAIEKGWIKEVDTSSKRQGWISMEEEPPNYRARQRLIVSDGVNSVEAWTTTLCRVDGKIVAPARYGDGIEVKYWMHWPDRPKMV